MLLTRPSKELFQPAAEFCGVARLIPITRKAAACRERHQEELSGDIRSYGQSRALFMFLKAATKQTDIRHRREGKRRDTPPSGRILLLAAIVLVAYGIYLYQLQPLLTMRLPGHEPLPLDSPPVELTTFQIRVDGDVATPAAIAVNRDSLYVAFVGRSLVQVYAHNLKLAKSLRLDKPATVTPISIAVTDSQLVVADTLKGLIAVYDHEGYYLSSVAWYPGRKTRLRPADITTSGVLLAATDRNNRQVAVISLIRKEPFYDFLELMYLIPGEDKSRSISPSCAAVVPDGNIWIGDAENGKGYIFSPKGSLVRELEQPARAKITSPVDFAIVCPSDIPQETSLSGAEVPPSDRIRVHLLDKVTGKVCVYDLTGRLTLVYPRDRSLNEPTAMAIDCDRRRIFITESGSRAVTVFGY